MSCSIDFNFIVSTAEVANLIAFQQAKVNWVQLIYLAARIVLISCNLTFFVLGVRMRVAPV